MIRIPRVTRIATILVIAAAFACGRALDLTNPHTVATELHGTWKQPNEVPGSSYQFTIAVSNDTLIAGVGTYSIEAGESGTLDVNGTLTGTAIQLAFVTSVSHDVQHFNGTLKDENTLTGSFWTEGTTAINDPIIVTFVRVN